MIPGHLLEGHRAEVTELVSWLNADVSVSFTKELIAFESTLKIRKFYL